MVRKLGFGTTDGTTGNVDGVECGRGGTRSGCKFESVNTGCDTQCCIGGGRDTSGDDGHDTPTLSAVFGGACFRRLVLPADSRLRVGEEDVAAVGVITGVMGRFELTVGDAAAAIVCGVKATGKLGIENGIVVLLKNGSTSGGEIMKLREPGVGKRSDWLAAFSCWLMRSISASSLLNCGNFDTTPPPAPGPPLCGCNCELS